MLVIAAMIGFGVFSSSGFALDSLGNPGRVILAWALCGVWAIAGAVAYGSLAKRVPLSGGEYLYLSRLWHPSLGFLAGWISLIAGFTAPIAGAAKLAAIYAFPSVTDEVTINWIASAVIVIGCICHATHIGVGAFAQNMVVVLKLGLIVALIVWSFALVPNQNWQGAPLPGRSVDWLPSDRSGWLALFASMSWIALSYTGFNAAVYVAGESAQAKRNVPLAMWIGAIVVTVLYLLLNVVFVYGPSSPAVVQDLASKRSVAAIAARALGGSTMESLTRVIIVLAVVSSVFGMLLAGPRVYAQMARDGTMPDFIGRGQIPRTAIVTQALLSIVVVWLAKLEEIIGYLGMTLSLCSALAIAGLWFLNQRRLSEIDARAEFLPVKAYEYGCAALYIVGTLMMLIAVLLQGERVYEVYALVATLCVGFVVYGIFFWGRPRMGSHP